MSVVLAAVLTLAGLALLFGLMLFGASRVFAVQEDPRVKDVAGLLPGINCGACGFAGCEGLANALVSAADGGDISALACPPGGDETMQSIGDYFGLEVGGGKSTVAVLRCNGSCQAAPPKVDYRGALSCSVADITFAGASGCAFGCVGLGECAEACPFDAISMDAESGLPVVDAERCTSCGICVSACPRRLFEIRPRGRRDRRVWVNCRNTEPGPVAKRNCSVACIGCGLCKKTCDTIVQAITVADKLAYIDHDKCIACGKCINVCPTNAIASSFPPPPKQPKQAAQAASKE